MLQVISTTSPAAEKWLREAEKEEQRLLQAKKEAEQIFQGSVSTKTKRK
jgi:hypothetical protein